MLSYQHGYHAGHFVDVHKHTALLLILRHLLVKPSPFCVIDTHAGAGSYDLTGDQARKTGEWCDGIGRLLAAGPPRGDGLRAYVAAVRNFNGAGSLERYPGSPMIAAQGIRACDRVIAMELHPAEHAALAAALGRRRNVHLHRRDGFEGLVALVPPLERRGLVLIDPSYEIKDDYARVPRTVARALGRWPNGIYVAWYPVLPEARHDVLLAGFREIAEAGRPILTAELTGPERPRGLVGTGLAIVNPPYRFAESLSDAGTEMAACLFAEGEGHHLVGDLAPVPL